MSEVRRHPRFELLVSVELTNQEEVLVLPARNLSLGGIYLASDGHDLTRFKIGERFELLAFDGMDEGTAPIRTMAKIVRHDGQGIALEWDSEDPNFPVALGSFIAALRNHPPT